MRHRIHGSILCFLKQTVRQTERTQAPWTSTITSLFKSKAALPQASVSAGASSSVYRTLHRYCHQWLTQSDVDIKYSANGTVPNLMAGNITTHLDGLRDWTLCCHSTIQYLRRLSPRNARNRTVSKVYYAPWVFTVWHAKPEISVLSSRVVPPPWPSIFREL